MTDRILLKAVTIKGVLGKGSDSFRLERSELMESGSLPLESLHTHTFALEDAAEAIQTLSGEIEGRAGDLCRPRPVKTNPSTGAQQLCSATDP